jgi:hypothetical protein
MARGGKLLRTPAGKLARTCGPPGCTNATPFTACNGVTPDSLTVTFDGITSCTGCTDVPSNFVEGAPLTSSYQINPIDINKSFCLQATGQNTWLINIEGDYGTFYNETGCSSGDTTALNILQVAVTAIGDGAGGWFYWVSARVGTNHTLGGGLLFFGVLFTYFNHYVGHGGTADIVKCCQCPSTGAGCCDTINLTVSGDADIAGDYTFVRNGNHWNGENGSIIHCVRGRWETIVKSVDGTKSVVWIAGDGVTSMDCPPTGDPADWGTPQLNGASSATLESIDCGAATCDTCHDTYTFALVNRELTVGYRRSTLHTGGDDVPCKWDELEPFGFGEDGDQYGSIVRDEANGVWRLTYSDDGDPGFTATAPLAGNEDCPPTDIEEWTVGGGEAFSSITFTD